MNLKNLLFTLIIVLSIASCSKKSDPTPTPPTPPPPTTPYVPDNSFKIIAYMPSYRDPAAIPDAKYKMITHMFFAFLNVNTTGDGSVIALTSAETLKLNTLKAKTKANNVKFGISVMGAESIFAAIAANPTFRTTFVNNVVNFAKANELDGVDIDWEYPRTMNGGPNTDYTLLMQQLSTELHKVNKFVSAAITPGVYVSTNRDAIESAAYQYVDFFNIMIYDGGVNYDSTEPLNHASMKMTDASLNQWLVTKAMPKEKAILGIPLYGKSSTGASLAYSTLETTMASINSNVATVNGIDYGYNGVTAVKLKAQKAKDRCNGVMFWELFHDSNSANSLIKAANDQLGRAY